MCAPSENVLFNFLRHQIANIRHDEYIVRGVYKRLYSEVFIFEKAESTATRADEYFIAGPNALLRTTVPRSTTFLSVNVSSIKKKTKIPTNTLVLIILY